MPATLFTFNLEVSRLFLTTWSASDVVIKITSYWCQCVTEDFLKLWMLSILLYHFGLLSDCYSVIADRLKARPSRWPKLAVKSATMQLRSNATRWRCDNNLLTKTFIRYIYHCNNWISCQISYDVLQGQPLQTWAKAVLLLTKQLVSISNIPLAPRYC